jgi:CRP-like cAMP-binding protein
LTVIGSLLASEYAGHHRACPTRLDSFGDRGYRRARAPGRTVALQEGEETAMSIPNPSGEPAAPAYCVVDRLDALATPAWGSAPPPWAPGRREEVTRVDRIAADGVVLDDRLAMLSKIDILADLNPEEMRAIMDAAPMRTYPAGDLLYTPHRPVETLFLLKRGRVRIFRVAADGRALTTAIVPAGTIFGEMVLLGQHMYDNYAEALDETLTCAMDRADVHKHLLSDPRIATRIAEILGHRLAAMERRLSDTVFKTVPQRIAATLCTLSTDHPPTGTYRVALTHEQIAALTGTARETATKALGELADRGLLRVGRGKITIMDPERLAAEAGNH